ncbi:hypothetical protein GCM10010278_76370 [Streptomyces melanogenes]|nr:hypothetical protein GCM10010278_76370 [Streptomyces melanogenes]
MARQWLPFWFTNSFVDVAEAAAEDENVMPAAMASAEAVMSAVLRIFMGPPMSNGWDARLVAGPSGILTAGSNRALLRLAA